MFDNAINTVIIGGNKYKTDENLIFILAHHYSVEIGDSISTKKE